MYEESCRHYDYGWMKVYRRPWRRLFRKEYHWVCMACGGSVCELEKVFVL